MAKRQRQVFKTDEVVHLWAHQAQQSGRNPQGNLSFDGAIARSYSTNIAKLHIAGKPGRRVMLIVDNDYSVTTLKHKRLMRYACRQYDQFTVTDIGSLGRIYHKANLRRYKSEITRFESLCRKARDRAGYYAGECYRICEESEKYAVAFGLKTRFATPAFPELAEKERRTTINRAARQAKWNIQREQARKNAALSFAERLPRWLAGDNVYLGYNGPFNYLRIEGHEAVTTRGARVPLGHIVRVWPIIKRLIDQGKEYHANGHTIHLGHYQLDSIDTAGTVKAGCHTFEKSEVLRFGAVLEALPAKEVLSETTV